MTVCEHKGPIYHYGCESCWARLILTMPPVPRTQTLLAWRRERGDQALLRLKDLMDEHLGAPA